MGRLKHLQQGLRSFGHLPNTKLQRANEAYGFGGAEFWWDAAYGLSTNVNGASVSFWNDRISGARWQQTTAANQPIFISSSAINANYPSIQENNTRRFFTILSPTSLPCFGKTIAFVHKTVGFVQFNTLLHSSGTPATPVISVGGTGAAVTGIGTYLGSNNAAVVATTIENVNSHITIVNPNAIIVDGVVAATGTINFTDPFINLLSHTANAYNFYGELGELLIYNRNLTNVQAQELCNNLNAKWAIY